MFGLFALSKAYYRVGSEINLSGSEAFAQQSRVNRLATKSKCPQAFFETLDLDWDALAAHPYIDIANLQALATIGPDDWGYSAQVSLCKVSADCLTLLDFLGAISTLETDYNDAVMVTLSLNMLLK